MVVGELRVVDVRLPEPEVAGEGLGRRARELRVIRGEGGHEAGEVLDHVGREVPALGAGVREVLPLVELLGELEDARGGEAPAAVRLLLEGQEVEEGRRRGADLARLDARDGGGGPGLDLGEDRPRPREVVDAGLSAEEEPGAEAQVDVDLGVGDGLERLDLALARDDEGEGGRLDAADGAGGPVQDRVGARGVEAHEPVGVGARAGPPARGDRSARRSWSLAKPARMASSVSELIQRRFTGAFERECS